MTEEETKPRLICQLLTIALVFRAFCIHTYKAIVSVFKDREVKEPTVRNNIARIEAKHDSSIFVSILF